MAGEPLSLDEALQRALGFSTSVQIARARLAQAEARVRIARAETRPQIRSLLSYQRTFRSIFGTGGFPDDGGLDPFVPDPTLPLAERVRRLEEALVAVESGGGLSGLLGGASGFPLGQKNTWIGAFTVDQPLYAGGRLRKEVEVAEREADVAALTLAEAGSDVIQQVKQAYYEAVLAASLVDIARVSIEHAEEQIRIARVRYNDGTGSELEALRAEVERDNLVPELVDATNTLERSLLTLQELIEMPLAVEPILTTGLCPRDEGRGRPDHLPPPPVALELIRDRPLVRAGEREVQARAAQLSIARRAFLPTVNLFGNLGWQAFPVPVFPSPADWREDWYAVIEARLPIYLGGRRRAEIDQAYARVLEAEEELEQTEDTAEREYRQAYGEVERTWAEIEERRGTLVRAERIWDLNRLRYEEGVAIPLEVLDARDAQQRAQTNLVRSYYDFFVAVANAEHALGLPLEAMVLPGACPGPAPGG